MSARLTSIRMQLIGVALLVSAGVAALFVPFARTQVEHGFDAFEVTYVAQERERLERTLQDQAARLGRTAIDYSHWDETVQYVAGERPQWIDENLTTEVFENFGVAAIVVADRDLGIVAARAPATALPAAQAVELVRGAGLCAAAMRERTFVSRFAWIDGVPQIVVCAPIMPVDLQPPDVVGAMAWAVRLDEAKIAEVVSLTRFPFALHRADDVPAEGPPGDGIVATLPLRNSDGTVGMMAALALPRPLGDQRDVVMRTMLLLLLCAVIIPSLLMLALLEVFVARRIRRVSHWVRSMRREDGPGSTRRPPPDESGFVELRMLTHDFAETHDKVRQLNRVYAVRSSINGLIVRATDRDELFQGACRILVEQGRFAKAWIGMVDASAPPIRMLAWAGADDAFFADLQRRLTANAGNSSGVLARTLGGACAVVCNDIESDPTVLERRLLLDSGSRAFALFPLIVDGHTVGAMSIHSPVPGAFDEEETALLLGLASDIAFALDNLMKADRIGYLAHHDALTGLPNRVRFAELLARQIGEAPGEPFLCVALMDLVRFRRINETLGRRAGDDLLVQVGARLRGVDAFAARIGPDVFALRLMDRRSAGELVRDFEHVARHCFDQPFQVGSEEVRMGCRFGAAVAPADGDDAETLLRNAESALRKARSSTAPFVFYEAGMNTRVSEALAQETKLRRAIEHDEFVLHYQPKVSVDGRRICGVEALIRWQDPERGLIPPMQFIPVLEETGLIATVGAWALRRALDDVRQWKERCGIAVRVAVNVSPLQLNQPNFARQVADLIGADGGQDLELEITESVIMDDVDRKIAMLGELRRLGVRIAIDDFGTGYSSLAYISRLPITSLKIDRVFVNNLATAQGYSLVSSIIGLARPLNLEVVAEGVETEEQARLLGLLRCDLAQGYFFSRPVAAARLVELLMADRTATPASPRAASGTRE